jgi:hypothetical protein
LTIRGGGILFLIAISIAAFMHPIYWQQEQPL